MGTEHQSATATCDLVADVPPSWPKARVAVTGASGYVGRLIAHHLAAGGTEVRAIARDPGRLPQGPGIEPWSADVSSPKEAVRALEGADAAYYLVHAMGGGARFADRDREAARTFAAAAEKAGVGRIVYLGALGRGARSEHLASRQEVGEILRRCAVPTVELQAAVVLGAGSISFEMLRHLTERLPLMVCPRWIDTALQPVAERDLVRYLQEALCVPPGVYQVGSPDRTSYHDMMQAYARLRGLRPRAIVEIPLLTPSLSAHWVDLVTPVDRAVSHALIESLRCEVVVDEPPDDVFSVTPLPVAAAIGAALHDEATEVGQSLLERPEGTVGGVTTLRLEVAVPAERVAAVGRSLSEVGGDLRWYGSPAMWWLRRTLGRLFGEHLTLKKPPRVERGAVADWWTVVRVDSSSLVLASRGWFFGEAWLGYQVHPGHPRAPGRLVQVAAFRPRGLAGLCYWRLLGPVHRQVFRAMARRRARAPRGTRWLGPHRGSAHQDGQADRAAISECPR